MEAEAEKSRYFGEGKEKTLRVLARLNLNCMLIIL